MTSTLSVRAQERAHERRWWILVVLCFSLLVIVLDNTILNVAIPTIPGLADVATGAFIDGMHAGVLLAAGVALLGAVIALIWLPARASYDALDVREPKGADLDLVAAAETASVDAGS